MKLLVNGLMTEEVFALRPEDDLATLQDLMTARRVRHVPIVDGGGDLVGLVTHRDLLRHSLIEQEGTPGFAERALLTSIKASDIMTRRLETVSPDDDIREAAQIMIRRKIGCLPVVEGRRLVGILTEADFVRLLARGD